ncbi:hypothetical protein F4805DRAFT_452390 [Annulohypoxylon moriforme]|nr:hypothetical protein F4805DRAFT_452390 [Annulohypoxylon moriforme]
MKLSTAVFFAISLATTATAFGSCHKGDKENCWYGDQKLKCDTGSCHVSCFDVFDHVFCL